MKALNICISVVAHAIVVIDVKMSITDCQISLIDRKVIAFDDKITQESTCGVRVELTMVTKSVVYTFNIVD